MNIVQFLVALIVPLIVLALLLWALRRLIVVIPGDQQIKNIALTVLEVVAIVAVCLWLLKSFGLLGPIGPLRVN